MYTEASAYHPRKTAAFIVRRVARSIVLPCRNKHGFRADKRTKAGVQGPVEHIRAVELRFIACSFTCKRPANVKGHWNSVLASRKGHGVGNLLAMGIQTD